jgi:hypothetical protein
MQPALAARAPKRKVLSLDDEELRRALEGPTLVVHRGRSQVLSPDTTMQEGTYEVVGVKGPDGAPVPIKGSYLNTLVKKGGAYQIAGHMAFAPPPPEMAPIK